MRNYIKKNASYLRIQVKSAWLEYDYGNEIELTKSKWGWVCRDTNNELHILSEKVLNSKKNCEILEQR